ncbi:MAG: type 4a pilus biogenesis protein PilO [Fimbriimonadaceae bacterium]|nr:type 4a pilus biogenesis protein PilO [Fimbriimonadaceae bacterium]NUM37629.1 type 4a pilus biogenesis protein PilO [Armatimonadota bacterium]
MKKTTNAVPWIALALASILVGGGATFWLYSATSEKSTKLDRLRVQAKEFSEVEKDLAKVENELTEAQFRLEHLEKGIPEFAYIPTFLKELEQYGTNSGIRVFGVRPIPAAADKSKKPKKEKKPYVELLIEIRGRGPFDNALAFIESLKKFPKIVAARSVALTPKNEPGSTAAKQLDVVVELRTFVFRPTPAELEMMDAAARAAAGLDEEDPPKSDSDKATEPTTPPSKSDSKSAGPKVAMNTALGRG